MLVAVTTSSTVLLPSIPHLYKLAQYPIVLHVALQAFPNPDYSEITAIRQSGFVFLQSETLQEAQDIALTAHALAIKSGKGVIHFFDPANSKDDSPIEPEDDHLVRNVLALDTTTALRVASENSTSLYVDDGRRATIAEEHSSTISDSQSEGTARSTAPPGSSLEQNSVGGGSSVGSSVRESSADSRPTLSSATSIESSSTRPITSDDIYDFLAVIWLKISRATGRSYQAFEYTGPDNAESALFIFGSTGLFVDELGAPKSSDEFAKCGLITARLYRPWNGPQLAESLPASVKRIAVLEQIRRKTTKWGPLLLDVLTSLRTGPSVSGSLLVVGYQLGYIEAATVHQALKGIFQNLTSDDPYQNLKVGSQEGPRQAPAQYGLTQPKVEKAYMKILNQVFGERLYIANSLSTLR